MVTLYVEDSGPGVPAAKQKALFKKFQESLDVLSQGTVGTNANSKQRVPLDNFASIN